MLNCPRMLNCLQNMIHLITRTNLVSISRRREKKPSDYRHNTAAITPFSNSFLAGIFASEPITSLETWHVISCAAHAYYIFRQWRSPPFCFVCFLLLFIAFVFCFVFFVLFLLAVINFWKYSHPSHFIKKTQRKKKIKNSCFRWVSNPARRREMRVTRPLGHRRSTLFP